MAVGVGAAQAADTITSAPGCCNFTAPEFRSSQGETPQFAVNSSDGAPHNVTADKKGPDGKPLFKTDTFDSGSKPVKGAEYLSAGRYTFECTIHVGMTSALVVDSSGKAVPRPAVRLTLPSQSLKQVRSSGKLKVSLRAVTAASGVALTAKANGKPLGRLTKIGLPKGATRIVSVKLTATGRKALAGRVSALVTVTSAVPSGAPKSAKRTLR